MRNLLLIDRFQGAKKQVAGDPIAPATAAGALIGLFRAIARDFLGRELEMDEPGRRGEPESDPGGQGI